jgi:hypothetical protein
MVNIEEVLHDTAVEEARRRWGPAAMAIRGMFMGGGGAFSLITYDEATGKIGHKGLGRSWKQAFADADRVEARRAG